MRVERRYRNLLENFLAQITLSSNRVSINKIDKICQTKWINVKTEDTFVHTVFAKTETLRHQLGFNATFCRMCQLGFICLLKS